MNHSISDEEFSFKTWNAETTVEPHLAKKIREKIAEGGLNPNQVAIARLLSEKDPGFRREYMLGLVSPEGRTANEAEVDRAIAKAGGTILEGLGGKQTVIDKKTGTKSSALWSTPRKPPVDEVRRLHRRLKLHDSVDLTDADLQSPDGANHTVAEFIALAYEGLSKPIYISNQFHGGILTVKEAIKAAPWIVKNGFDQCLCNPVQRKMTAEERASGKYKSGGRHNDFASKTLDVVTVENDSLSKDEQLRVILFIKRYLPLCYIVDSGGKSLHATFSLKGLSKKNVMRLRIVLAAMGADPCVLKPVQLTRLGGARRTRPRGAKHKKAGADQCVMYMDRKGRHTAPCREAVLKLCELVESASESCVETEECANEGFPITSLPGDVRALCHSAHESLGVAMPIVAMNVLGITSTALGGGVYAELVSGQKTLPNSFLLIISQSGTGKSKCYSTLNKPLQEAEDKQVKLWLERRAAAQADMNLLKHRRTDLRKKISKEPDSKDLERAWHELERDLESATQKASKESRPWFTINDFTEEALGVSCFHQKHQALGVHTAEGRNFFKIIMGRYGGNGATAENILLAGYSGDECKVTRLNREPISLRPCLSLLVAVQDDVFRRALNDTTFTESGLFPRCLIYRSLERIQPRTQTPPPIEQVCLDNWHKRITELITAYRFADKPVKIKLSKKASADLHSEANREIEKLRDHSQVHDAYAARYGENLIKITLILHALIHGENAHLNTVQSRTVGDAIKIMRWFRKQQTLLLGEAERDSLNILRDRVLQIMSDAERKWISLRDLKNSHGITKENCDLLAQKFSSFEIKNLKSGNKGGRPSMRLIFNDDE